MYTLMGFKWKAFIIEYPPVARVTLTPIKILNDNLTIMMLKALMKYFYDYNILEES